MQRESATWRFEPNARPQRRASYPSVIQLCTTRTGSERRRGQATWEQAEGSRRVWATRKHTGRAPLHVGGDCSVTPKTFASFESDQVKGPGSRLSITTRLSITALSTTLGALPTAPHNDPGADQAALRSRMIRTSSERTPGCELRRGPCTSVTSKFRSWKPATSSAHSPTYRGVVA